MPQKELICILLVTFILLLQKACAQSYYDLYSDDEVYRKTSDGILEVAPAALKSTSLAAKNQTDNEIPTDVVQHKNLPKIAVVVLLAMAVGIFIAVWHAHFMRKRKRLLLRKDFGMTNRDTYLSSSALSNDPLRSLSRYDSFRIPMPDPIPHETYVTPPSGNSAHNVTPKNKKSRYDTT